MSRLDSFIRRLRAQRACLGMAAELVTGVEGIVLELGLGNGRTFDHLRSLLPQREIYVFDRRIAAHPSCIPDESHIILGDIFETLSSASARLGRRAVLAHSDIGTGDAAANDCIAAFVGRHLPRLMARGGVIVSDQSLTFTDWTSMPLPTGVRKGRYFVYRRD